MCVCVCVCVCVCIARRDAQYYASGNLCAPSEWIFLCIQKNVALTLHKLRLLPMKMHIKISVPLTIYGA